jgi:hypothetical protein
MAMLRQEINLYRQFNAPASDADYLTWKRYWIMNIIVTLVFIFICITSAINNMVTKGEYDKAQTQLKHYQAEFAALKNTFPQVFFNENIDDSVKNLKKEMEVQRQIVAILSNHEPFSEDLMALSRSTIPNVWLTNINITKNNSEIVLKGESLGMNVIQDYISTLQREKNFSNKIVNVHEVNNKDLTNPNARLTFKISMVAKANE